jgi:hypothetical protein
MAAMLLKNGFKAKGRKITNFFEGFEATNRFTDFTILADSLPNHKFSKNFKV